VVVKLDRSDFSRKTCAEGSSHTGWGLNRGADFVFVIVPAVGKTHGGKKNCTTGGGNHRPEWPDNSSARKVTNLVTPGLWRY